MALTKPRSVFFFLTKVCLASAQCSVHGRLNHLFEGWINEWTDGWVNGRMGGSMRAYLRELLDSAWLVRSLNWYCKCTPCDYLSPFGNERTKGDSATLILMHRRFGVEYRPSWLWDFAHIWYANISRQTKPWWSVLLSCNLIENQ